MFSKYKIYNLFYFYPILLITGPFIPDLLLVLLSIYFILNYQKFNFKKIFFFNIFFSFYIYLIISSLLSQEIIHSIKSSLPYIRFFFLIFGAYNLYLIDNNFLKKISYSLYASLSIVFLFLIFQKYQLLNLIPLNDESSAGRFTGPFGDDLIMGAFSLKIYMLIAFFTYFTNNNNKVLILLTFYLLSFYLIIHSGERSAFYLFIIFSLSFYFINKRFFFLLLIIKIIFFFIILNFNSLEIYKKRLIEKTLQQTVYDKKIFSKQHNQHYKVSLEIFKKYPFFGSGPNSFRHECKNFKNIKNGCSTHPHNLLFQFLSELGLIGFLFLMYFYYKLIKDFLYHDNKVKISVVICFINFFPFLPFGNFFNNYLSLFLFMSFVPYIIIKRSKNEH